MIGFGIDEIQANYVAEIKLRNINREYILKRTQETDAPGEGDRRSGGYLVNSPGRIKAIIVKELENVAKKYGTDRRTSHSAMTR